MITDKELHDAWDRIARSSDGKLIYLHLQRQLMAVTTSTEDGALPRLEGQRIFAAKLIYLMAKGIEESAGSSDFNIYTFAGAGALAVSSARGAGRRVTLDTFVPGYDAPDRGSTSE